MYITRELLKEINLRTGESNQTNPKPPEVSQPLKKDKRPVSFRCTKIKQEKSEKLDFSKREF